MRSDTFSYTNYDINTSAVNIICRGQYMLYVKLVECYNFTYINKMVEQIGSFLDKQWFSFSKNLGGPFRFYDEIIVDSISNIFS